MLFALYAFFFAYYLKFAEGGFTLGYRGSLFYKTRDMSHLPGFIILTLVPFLHPILKLYVAHKSKVLITKNFSEIHLSQSIFGSHGLYGLSASFYNFFPPLFKSEFHYVFQGGGANL